MDGILNQLAEFTTDAILWIALLILARLGRQLGRVLEAAWARDHLASVADRIVDAVLAAGDEYLERMRAAREDGVITEQERRAARRASLERAFRDLDLNVLARALGRSRGRRATRDDAAGFVETRVDRVLAEHRLRPRPIRPEESDDTAPGTVGGSPSRSRPS